jgi:hypothetical protein
MVDFATTLRRWYPGRLFLPRENRRSIVTVALEVFALAGVPALLLGTLLVRSRWRHAARLRQAVAASAGKGSAAPVAAGVGGAGMR